MVFTKNKQTLKTFSLLIKVSIVLLAFWFIYKQVFAKKDILHKLGQLLQDPFESPMFLLVLALVFVNWGFEALKWKSLIDKIEKISLLKAYKAIFSGVTVSIFTPNRIGEYAGRIFHLEKADRINAMLITMVCSVGQLMVTIFAGLIALSIFIPLYTDVESHLNIFSYYALSALTVGLAFFLLTAYINASLLSPMIKK